MMKYYSGAYHFLTLKFNVVNQLTTFLYLPSIIHFDEILFKASFTINQHSRYSFHIRDYYILFKYFKAWFIKLDYPCSKNCNFVIKFIFMIPPIVNPTLSTN